MDMLSPILDLVKWILAPIRKCYNFHRGVDEEMRILRDKWRILENRKVDTESRMKSELLPGKQPKKEVEGWLEKVDTINGEVQAIEEKFAKMKYFSHAHVGKLAFKMRGEVEKHHEMGDFPECLVLDPPVSNGEILPTPPTLRGETIKEEIWACVLNDDVRKIGVYGMGGIGKSTVMKHINNSLLKETHKFDSIIWVSMSKEFNVIKLQHDIARKLVLDLTKFEDETSRAAELHKMLKRTRYVLILDDLWEAFPLEDIGIPEPTQENGCKLVLTTRLLDVCRRMGCMDIKMELLSNEEARKLFLDKMGRDVFDTPNLKAIAEEVLRRCARLPLAIVTIAASFKCLIHDFEWRDALEDLRTSVKGSNNTEAKVLKILEFSYERLKDVKLQQCLLHCALYPDDFAIEKRELILHLIDEGIIERRNSRQAEFDRGYSMLNKLENACLLEGVIGEYGWVEFVKMHDLVRDMVLQVASPQFRVGHLGLEEFSDEGKWREDVVKASLMYNNILRIPPNVSPMCPKLSTLLLQGNRSLEDVPDSLFEHLHGLDLLDLSYTNIESLPNSISNLENLTTLRLGECWKLTHVPSLAKLTKLRKLDLWLTGITKVPDGLEMLVNLRYLDLNTRTLKIMPPGILPKLSHLQYLTFFWKSESLAVKGEEVASLKKLETLRAKFCNVSEFNTYIRYLENGRLLDYKIHVGISEIVFPDMFSLGTSPEFKFPCKNLGFVGCGEGSFVVPKDVHDLWIIRCDNLRSLCDVPSLNNTSELKHIFLYDCKGIEHILCCSSSLSSSCTLPHQTPEILEIQFLDNLRILFRKEKDASAQVPPHTFSSLKIIQIFSCLKLKKLLPPGLLVHLNNLEEIQVKACEQLEEIIEEEEKEEEGMDTTKITLPRLKILWLESLPELKSICSSSKVMVCDSLKEISIERCLKLKRLPLSLPLLNGQLSPPPSLKKIKAKEEWWESLEWDSQDTKNVLQPFFWK